MILTLKSCDIVKLIRAAGMQRRKSDGANSYRSVKADRLLALSLLFLDTKLGRILVGIVHHFWKIQTRFLMKSRFSKSDGSEYSTCTLYFFTFHP